MLPALNFPAFQFQIIPEEGRQKIFDPARKKYVALTPEEWVRQHTIRFLNESLHYPLSHMIVEHSLRLNKLHKRADILVYDAYLKPFLLVECKAPGVPVNDKVLEQVSRYNLIFKVPWLLVTNGLVHYSALVCHQTSTTRFSDHLPSYTETGDE